MLPLCLSKGDILLLAEGDATFPKEAEQAHPSTLRAPSRQSWCQLSAGPKHREEPQVPPREPLGQVSSQACQPLSSHPHLLLQLTPPSHTPFPLALLFQDPVTLPSSRKPAQDPLAQSTCPPLQPSLSPDRRHCSACCADSPSLLWTLPSTQARAGAA